jgi:RND superfamily putative drug exporter
MSSLTRWVLAHKSIVVAFWLVVTLVGLATVSAATGALKQKLSVPGREGWQTNDRITRIYHSGGNNAALVPVVTLPAGTTVSSPQVPAGLTDVARRVERAVPGTRIASYATTGDRAFVSKDGRTTFVIAYPPPSKEAFGDNRDAADGSSSAGRGTLTRVRDAAHDAGTGVRVGGIPQ